VSSLIAEHARDQIQEYPEIDPVRLRVLAPWRTLVEKLLLLHTAHIVEDPDAARRGARHYYDVHQLLARPEIVDGIRSDGIAILSRDVCTYSNAAEMPAQPRPTGGFATSPAFTDGVHLAVARTAYNQSVLAQLVWPGADPPSFDQCLAAAQNHRENL
jgi:hypothetical protein